jgi:hypothetical protein
MEDDSPRRLLWTGVTVGAATAAWLFGLGWLGLVTLIRMIVSESADDAPRVPDTMLVQLLYGLAALLVVGPLLIAGLARLLRIGGVARVYIGICCVAVVPALYVGWLAWTEVHPRVPQLPSPSAPQSHCVAYSGGSNSCPGG